MNFITPEQVAEMLKVSTGVVLQWLRQKKIPGVKIGNVWRIEEERLNTFLLSELSNHTFDIKEEYSCSEDAISLEPPYPKGKRGRKPSGKYDGLKTFLKQSKGDRIKLSFSEIEEKMKDKLPGSAYRLRPWWGNDFSHSQARAWLHAGWEVSGVDLANRLITFMKRIH